MAEMREVISSEKAEETDQMLDQGRDEILDEAVKDTTNLLAAFAVNENVSVGSTDDSR